MSHTVKKLDQDSAVANRAAHGAALDWLMGRINYERTAFIPYQERQLKLDRMRQLLTRLGQPDAGMKIVHVAGTKGKGSTCAMIAGILTAAGFRTGLFSSPHLERIEERFAVDGQPCTAPELVALVDRLRPVARAMDEEAAADGDPTGGPTYFEVTTAMALLHFVEHEVDAAMLEVGLGGRLDSTNVCLPAVSVITSISFDHMKQLGNTLADIAREKAGIIKPGVPVVCGVTEPEPQAVIAEIARDHGCRLIQLERDFTFTYQQAGSSPTPKANDKARMTNDEVRLSSSFVIRHSSFPTLDFAYSVPGQEHQLRAFHLGMRGPHQAANAAVALATITELRHQGWCSSEDAIRAGLRYAALPGRVEVFPGEPVVVLDAAHNPASAQALIAALAEMPPAARRTLILSISHDKDVRAIVHELAPHFERFVVTEYQENPRAMPAQLLAEIIRGEAPQAPAAAVTVCRTPADAWQHVLQSALPAELLCITGSFYLAAEMRPLVLAKQCGTS
ncbi:MAG: folylpolyglutamate synthase/dihydrofolate synthase family protein [Pirellulales bacterium]